MLKESNYILIPAIARNKFKLVGNDLLVFSIIFGFSQTEKTAYTGSVQYLQEWTGLTERTILRILKKLTEKGLLIKRKLGPSECHYSINYSNVDCQNVSRPTDKMSCTDCQNVSRPTDKMSVYNIDRYYSDNIKEKNKRKNFRKPSIEEIKNYCKEIDSSIDAQRFFDYYQANGWVAGKVPMKDWKAAVRNWTRNNRNFRSQNKSTNKHDFQKEISQEELNQYDQK